MKTSTTTMTTTPTLTIPSIDTSELDKLLAVKDKSHAIAEFMDFLRGRGYNVECDVEAELARFFGIDRTKAEVQRTELWEVIRTKRN